MGFDDDGKGVEHLQASGWRSLSQYGVKEEPKKKRAAPADKEAKKLDKSLEKIGNVRIWLKEKRFLVVFWLFYGIFCYFLRYFSLFLLHFFITFSFLFFFFSSFFHSFCSSLHRIRSLRKSTTGQILYQKARRKLPRRMRALHSRLWATRGRKNARQIRKGGCKKRFCMNKSGWIVVGCDWSKFGDLDFDWMKIDFCAIWFGNNQKRERKEERVI